MLLISPEDLDPRFLKLLQALCLGLELMKLPSQFMITEESTKIWARRKTRRRRREIMLKARMIYLNLSQSLQKNPNTPKMKIRKPSFSNPMPLAKSLKKRLSLMVYAKI
jgi:hypothetical protein